MPAASALPAMIAAAASPVILFYGVGYLLAFGYFLALGPALMTAFSPTELALVGFARLSGAIAVSAFLAFLAISLSALVSARVRHRRPQLSGKADIVSGGVCLAAVAMIAMTSLTAGFLATMLAIVALVMMGGFAVAFLVGRQAWLVHRGGPWRWALPTVLLLIGLPSLGEAGFREALDDNRAQWIVVNGRPAKLLMLGAAAMIYDVDGALHLAGPRGEEPMRLGRPPVVRVGENPMAVPRTGRGGT